MLHEYSMNTFRALKPCLGHRLVESCRWGGCDFVAVGTQAPALSATSNPVFECLASQAGHFALLQAGTRSGRTVKRVFGERGAG